MDAGQITQGLRADCLQQNSNGAATAQFSGSGASFADIMGVIIANVQNGQDAENILNMQNFIGGQNMEILQNILNTQDMSYLKNILNMTDLFAIQNKLALNIQDISNSETENIFAGLNEINAEIQDENKTETLDENKPEISDDNISEPQDVNVSDVENENEAEATIKTEGIHTEDIQTEEKADLQNTVKPDNSVPDKILTVENKEVSEHPDKTEVKVQNNEQRPTVKNPYEPYMKEDEQNNVSRFNLHDINIASEKFSVNKSKTEKSDKDMLKMNAQKIAQNIKANKIDDSAFIKENLHFDNGLTQKLTDIFGIITPELMNSDERNRKDSFDFSESVIKADPLQLAGLLDFISTGIGIPEAMDISDSQLFKNVSDNGAMERVSERTLFDPEEMIESGEMEILSYTPAETKQKPVLTQPQDMLETDEKTIDFARTMKSVRENVKPIVSDEDDEVKTNVPVMTAEDMNNNAEKIDISFDRAYAELELNKTKYGSADKQLLKGISENLQKGRSEFTVKLRPEGLGEILVKLVSEDGGKAVLSMVASSEKTAQLLNRDLASLQSSLNQHNVEIENNSVKTLETVTATQSAFSQYDERRQDEANQQNQFRRIRKKLGNISVGNVSYDNESEPVSSNVIDSALNITI